jgi:AcrR family transcriptional regulator
MAQDSRKRTQLQRLLTGMIAVANRHGYAQATISLVIAEAGVSRPTFYDYFADRDACFQAAVDGAHRGLLERVERRIAQSSGNEALTATAEAILAFASEEPSSARFLMGESMAGGAGALDARDRGISQIAAAVGDAEASAGKTAAAPDIQKCVLIGGLYRMIAMRLRRDELVIAKLGDELRDWIACYERPLGQRRWQTLATSRVPAPSPYLPDAPLLATPGLLPPGRPRLEKSEIVQIHRQRILYAVAQLAAHKGYAETTVAEITRSASVDGRAFYGLFADKQSAFAAIYDLGFQQVMDVTAKAFFAAEGWPRRSWEAIRALTQLLQANPLFAHVGFVEAQAFGSGATQRIGESQVAFMFFLQEGLTYREQTTPPSRLAMEGVIAAMFETIYLQARKTGKLQIAAMLPNIAHIWLTPFMGVGDTEEFIDGQMPRPTRRTSPRLSRGAPAGSQART